MTEQERDLISNLAERIKSAPAPQVDRDADSLIRSAIGSRPDALYILTQTVLIQEMALKQAQAQIETLKQQAADSNAQSPQSGFMPSSSGYSQSRYAGSTPPQYQPPPQQVVYEEAPRRSGFSDFLHSAATTAAGVIAGEIAFDSLSSIFGHHGGYGGGGFFSGGGIMPGGETIVNNYYGDQGGGFEHGGESKFGGEAAASGDNLSPDIEDDRDKSPDNFADDGADDGSGDDLSSDSSDDDSGGDDFSGGDDSGNDSGF